MSAGCTLICLGHGASGDRYQPPICSLAARFVKEAKFPVLSLDGPVHGLRQVGDSGRTAFFPEFERDGCMEDMTDEWTCAVSETQARIRKYLARKLILPLNLLTGISMEQYNAA